MSELCFCPPVDSVMCIDVVQKIFFVLYRAEIC